MSVTRPAAIAAAQSIAQDAANQSSPSALLLDDSDYATAVNVALQQFSTDRPNQRIQHVIVATQDFRYVLYGTNQILPTTGLDQWVDGASDLRQVYTPFLLTTPDNRPLDENAWRVVAMPPDDSGPITVLELLAERPGVGSTMRLEYQTPHVIDDDTPAKTSIRKGDVVAFETLLAAGICQAAARRYVQNTGTSQFQTETIDRRTQSDVMAARARDLLKTYADIVGKASGAVIGGSAVHKMVIQTTHRRGRLWHLE